MRFDPRGKGVKKRGKGKGKKKKGGQATKEAAFRQAILR